MCVMTNQPPKGSSKLGCNIRPASPRYKDKDGAEFFVARGGLSTTHYAYRQLPGKCPRKVSGIKASVIIQKVESGLVFYAREHGLEPLR